MATASRIFAKTEQTGSIPLAALSLLAAAAVFVGIILFLASAAEPAPNQLPYTTDFYPW
jgi:hypothetical protein